MAHWWDQQGPECQEKQCVDGYAHNERDEAGVLHQSDFVLAQLGKPESRESLSGQT